MNHEVAYDLMINLPFNEETSTMYSMDEDMVLMSIEHALRHIEIIMDKDGFISLERIMKILGYRACQDTPHIFFDSLEGWHYAEGNLAMELCFGFEANTVHGKKHAPPKLKVVETMKEESGEEEWTPSKQQETSESGENGKT